MAGRAAHPAPLRLRAPGHGATLRLLTGTAEAFAHLRLPEGEALAPGATALVQLRCDPPLAAMAGDGFILRLPSPAHSIAGGTLVHPEDRTALRETLRASLAAFHAAHLMEAGLRPKALPAAITEPILAALLAEGAAERVQGLLHAPGFDPARALSGDPRELALGLAALFRRAGLAPPDTAEAAAGDPRRRAVLRFLLQRGVLVRTVDAVQRRTILFHRQAIEGTKRRLAEAPGGFTASEAGTLLGISRKYGIPLLERLDALRITRRVGDRRFLIRGSTAGRATAILAR